MKLSFKQKLYLGGILLIYIIYASVVLEALRQCIMNDEVTIMLGACTINYKELSHANNYRTERIEIITKEELAQWAQE